MWPRGAGRAPYLGEQLLHGVFLPYQLVELLLAVHGAAAPARAGEIFRHVAQGLAFFFKGFPLLELGSRRGRYWRDTRSPCRRNGRQAQLRREGDKGTESGRQRQGVTEEQRWVAREMVGPGAAVSLGASQPSEPYPVPGSGF